jgi:hypothetical protein
MTAHTSHQPSGRYRFRQLARMEWIKLRSLRSTWLTLAIAVAASAGIALAIGSSSTTSGGMFVGNTLVGMLIGVLLIGVVGVLADTATPGDQRRGSRAHLRSRLYGREPSDACPTRRADRTDLSWRDTQLIRRQRALM